MKSRKECGIIRSDSGLAKSRAQPLKEKKYVVSIVCIECIAIAVEKETSYN